MKSLIRIFHKVTDRFQSEYKIINVDELPEKVKERTIYIVGHSKRPWLMAFLCPCGCKNLIQLNLLKEAKPCWKFKITKKNKINIIPSVWRTTGCKSHFVVRKSKIDWVW